MTEPTPGRAWQPTGHTVRVDNPYEIDRIPEFDPRSGNHFWIVTQAHQVDPAKFADPTHTPILDQETLVSVAGPGCYHCEKPYTPLLATRRCKGGPDA